MEALSTSMCGNDLYVCLQDCVFTAVLLAQPGRGPSPGSPLLGSEHRALQAISEGPGGPPTYQLPDRVLWDQQPEHSEDRSECPG